MKQKLNLNITNIIIYVLVCAVIRALNVAVFNTTPYVQFTPLLAMCLFAGSIFKNTKQAILITLGTMIVSDLLIQNLYYGGQFGVMYKGWFWMYPLYIGIMLVGKIGLKKITVLNIFNSAVGSAILYFIISNFIVWIGGGGDARTNFLTNLPLSFDGLKQCYTQALPFFRSSLYGTLLYSGVLFGIYQLLSIYIFNKNITIAK
jgi:hypothetical protein